MAVLAQIVILLLLVLANGLFAMAEIAIVSARKGRLQAMADEGRAGAAAALKLAENPNRFLSTVQVGITLIGTLAGVFGGAALAKPLAALLAEVPWLAPYSDTLSLGLVVLMITYLSLVLGELAPKRIALTNAEVIGAAVAAPMMGLSRLTAPLISILSFSTGFVMRILGIRASDEPPVTEQEVLLMLEEGRQAGVFEAAEQNIVENVFRFADRRVAALITPYTELVWLDVDDPPETHWQQILSSPHNCFPVADDDLDNLLGFVCIRDIWQRMLDGEPVDLRALVRPPLLVPENLSALRLLTMFRQHAVQGALIVDEHGSILGLVTLTDILESLIGDVPDAPDDKDAPIVQRDASSWLVDGLLPVDEFVDYFGVDIAHEDEQAYQTLGGFIMNHLGRIPEAADVLVWGGLRFEVVDMDDMRVDKVLVEQVSSEETD
ncbi:MAG: HlyC/CorC family transporter [Anaerolineae bacterium]|nr:HlyC/CorC family transporter [Anaerolineae bacterium]